MSRGKIIIGAKVEGWEIDARQGSEEDKYLV